MDVITEANIRKNTKNVNILLLERERKRVIYEEYDSIIKTLEHTLRFCDSRIDEFIISLKIKNLKAKQKKYYVPSVIDVSAKKRIKTRK